MPAKCPDKRKNTNRKASKKHYEANKADYIARAAARRDATRAEWEAYKRTLSCVWCGFNQHPACLDHHHVIREGHQKVHRLIGNGSIRRAFEEIKKCIVLCATCHRFLHNDEEFERNVLEKVERMGIFKTALRRVNR